MLHIYIDILTSADYALALQLDLFATPLGGRNQTTTTTTASAINSAAFCRNVCLPNGLA